MFFNPFDDIICIIILVVGFVNLFIFWLLTKKIKNLENIVYPKSDRRNELQASLQITDKEIKKLNDHSEKASFWYTLFSNITAIFPLLGIFGTVWALMQMSGVDDLSSNFMSALKTTLWGLIFAIACKVLDAFVASKLDRALDESDYLVHKHDEEKRKQ